MIEVGDRLGHTTVVVLLTNKHGQKCAMVRCDCGAEVCRVLHDAKRGVPCRRCTQLIVGDRRVTSRSRVAVRYAKLCGVSITEAAGALGVSPGAVHNAWSRIYPTRQHPLAEKHKRPTCRACGQTGHLAVHGKCSPSEIAIRMVRSGTSVRAAAYDTGLTKQAVYAARDQRRRAA